MSAEANKETVRRIYAALELGDSAEFAAHVHSDYVWRVTGQCSWSGEFKGREAILRDLIGPLFGRLAGPYKARLRSVIAEGDVVVAEVEGDAATKGGDRYDNQ
jgi:ketosteroid isomerase-like protein